MILITSTVYTETKIAPQQHLTHLEIS